MYLLQRCGLDGKRGRKNRHGNTNSLSFRNLARLLIVMVAVPVAHDQPGVAAQIESTGTGVRIPATECEPARLRHAIETVMGQAFRDSARRFQRIMVYGE